MFTGIIEALGAVAAIDSEAAHWRLSITAPDIFTRLPVGSSVACSGACLTITGTTEQAFQVDVSRETLDCTAIGDWQVGSTVALERAMTPQSRFDGHIVMGHVDGVADLIAIEEAGASRALTLRAPAALSRFIAAKGSIALDGVALTVNDVKGDFFDIMIIPHTLGVLKWDRLELGRRFNMEVDLIARYVARLLERREQ